MTSHRSNILSRRQALKRTAAGFGGLALLDLLAAGGLGSTSAPGAPGVSSIPSPASGVPHLDPRAKRVIFLFMHGGPSHVDTFDYKPRLQTDHGKPLPFAKPR